MKLGAFIQEVVSEVKGGVMGTENTVSKYKYCRVDYPDHIEFDLYVNSDMEVSEVGNLAGNHLKFTVDLAFE